jgi:hypothetical protein
LRAELSGEPELDAIRTIFKKANINIWTWKLFLTHGIFPF